MALGESHETFTQNITQNFKNLQEYKMNPISDVCFQKIEFFKSDIAYFAITTEYTMKHLPLYCPPRSL